MSELKISKATRLIAQECNTFLNTYLIEYKRRQPNTIKSYKDMFSVYFKFLKSERDKEIWKITVDDFSSENIKERILLIDEPMVFHVLMEEFSRTFPSMSEDQKRLKKEELLRQLDELDKM